MVATTRKPAKPEREQSADELRTKKAERSAKLEVVKAGGSAAQLPLWEDWHRGIPNDITRTSLFTSRNNKVPRRVLKGEPVFAMGEIAATYRGEELRQDDERVWMQILHLARLQTLSDWVEFVPGEFMLALGWKSRGSREYDRLREILGRLQATALQIQSKRLNTGVSVSLIVSFQWRDLTRWRVKIEPEMKQLFPEDYYTRVQWEQRLELPNGIASKLHSYFASHRVPLPVKVCHLQELCGSEASPSEFRKSLRAALDSLVSVGFLLTWRFNDDDGTVEVRRA
jgi:TrfA protein